ncbi:MAG: GldG family protein [Gammaproteobacteria bacterium]|nr:GldG family protein [Gammaproteobacteria bacterium]
MKNRLSERLIDRLQGYSFIILFLLATSLLHGLNQQYNYHSDWTKQQQNSLSEASIQLVTQLHEPLEFTVFMHTNKPLRQQISGLLKRYQRHSEQIKITFINPDLHPKMVRQYNVRLNGETLIQYQGRSKTIQRIDEQSISNAIGQLIQQQQQWLLFLTGHGERKPFSDASHDLSTLTQRLQQQGIRIQQLNLAQTLSIPDNTQTLVIASPQSDLLQGEINIIRQYINRGGNLLWLTEPGADAHLYEIEQQLGIYRLPGMAVDANSLLLDIGDPSFVYITDYPGHPLNQSLSAGSLLPQPVALQDRSEPQWQTRVLLQTSKRSWTESGPISDTIHFDSDTAEQAGPLDLGWSMQREIQHQGQSRQQRIIIIGDGDFASNAYIGNGSNLEFASNIIHWLNHNDSLIDIPIRKQHNIQLNLGRNVQYIIAFGFLFILPLSLFITGIIIRTRRNRR